MNVAAPAVAVRLSDLSRHFGDVKALDHINLDIYDGEFFSMLGPSGSGKTTCLRLIAGFETPTSGSIQLFGQEVAGVPPYDRDVNTVFQDYALFPHMTVDQNVAYGMMIKKVAKKEREDRVRERELLDRVPPESDLRHPDGDHARDVRASPGADTTITAVPEPAGRVEARRATARRHPLARRKNRVAATFPGVFSVGIDD